MSFPVLDVFLSIMWFFLWVLWLYLVFWVIWDISRSSDLGGWAKTGWVALTVLVPLFGVLAYLIVRGSTTYERQRSADRHPWNQSRETGEPNGMDSTPAGQISHLADLRDRHVISQEEFLRAKEHVLR